MKAKSVFYAAVGAPVVAAKKVSEKTSDFSTKFSTKTDEYGQAFERAVDGWAVEGERVIGKISEGKVVDEITHAVDLDHAKEQVSKLRDQLEDMLDTWRHSFRPEHAEDKVAEVIEHTEEKVESAVEHAAEAVAEVETSVTETVEKIEETVAEKSEEITEKAEEADEAL